MARGDFLGCVKLTGGDLANFFSSDQYETEYAMGPSEALDAEANHLATKGSLYMRCVRACVHNCWM